MRIPGWIVILGAVAAGNASASLAQEGKPPPPPERPDSARLRTERLRRLLEIMRQVDSLRVALAPGVTCPMPVASVGGGAALRLRPPADSTDTRPAPMPTAPPGCDNPLFRKP